MTELKLVDLIDVDVLQQIQDGFSEFTGMASITTDADGIPVTHGSSFTDFCTKLTRKSSIGYERCKMCDKEGGMMTMRTGKAAIYNCHAGLVDFAAPIMAGNTFLGSFLGGQVRTKPVDEAAVRRKALELNIDPDKYVEAAKRTRMLTEEEVSKAGDFLMKIAKVLSEMAYNNYVALEQSRSQEKIAKSQMNFIMNLTSNMQIATRDWMGYIEHAKHSANIEEMHNMMDKLLEQSSEVYSIIEDAISYIQSAGGEVELVETEYDIYNLLQQVVDGSGNLSKDKDVCIDVLIDENVPRYLLGDAGRIGQIINKILQYVIVYTNEGIIRIEVSSARVSYATQLIITIRDEEKKIPSDKIEILRQCFARDYFHNTDTTDIIALGFSFIALLIKHVSGKITVENLEQGGSAYKIYLPQLAVKGGV